MINPLAHCFPSAARITKSFRGALHCSVAILLCSAGAGFGAPQQAVVTDTPAGRQGFPPRAEAPANAPNVLIVMTDDVGFGASSTFGGAIPTPNLDRVAQNGLRYANFHTTALCSPSRAALLTGRNHHAVGAGHVPDMATGEPGYTSVLPRSAATIAQVLSRNGYNTAFFGKNHNVPSWENGPLGPFTQWGNGLGFGYFYGFHGGMTDQFRPDLFENTQPVPTPTDPGYFLDRDLINHTISWFDMQHTTGSNRPFLIYIAPGTAHAPLQAPRAWLEKFRGKFSEGWDVYAAETFARQKRLGLIPRDAALPPRPPGVPAWASLSPAQQRVYARYMEAYAAALACFDDQFGRLLDHLEQNNELSNTLILFIQGDNGASPEGGQNGAVNYLGRTSPDRELAWAEQHIDDIGGPASYPVAPAGWAVALNTPWPYYKAVASRLGGTTNGLVVSWPAKIPQRGVRRQFTYLTDIAPTLYDAIGIAPPAEVDGVAQMPFDGQSMLPTFASANAPTLHTRQYFEMMGNSAIYDNGWLLATRMAPSNQAGHLAAAPDQPWLLYDLLRDPTQTTDVAAQHPDVAARLRAMYADEARRNHLEQRSAGVERLFSYNRPEYGNVPGRYIFRPGSWVYGEGTFPSLLNRDWTITADLVVPPTDASGTLVTQGGWFQGWGLLMRNGIAQFVYRRGDMPELITRLVAPSALSPGRHRVAVTARRDQGGPSGTFTMVIDGATVASSKVPSLYTFKFGNEPAVIGRETGTTLDGDPYPFVWPAELTVSLDMGPISIPSNQ